MDVVVRSRRPLLVVALGAALVACIAHAPGYGGAAIGESAAPVRLRKADGGAASTAPISGAQALPASYKTTFTKLNKDRMISQGHAAGRWEVDVYANEVAAKALAAKSHAVPVGAIVVEEHYERAGDKQRGPIMVMEKRAPGSGGSAKEHGDWRWAVIGSQGQLVKDGTIDSCAGCHDDSPMDGLFPF